MTLPGGDLLRRLDDGAAWTPQVPGPAGLVAAIEAIAGSDPERTAVVTREGRTSYAAVAALARALAVAIGVESTAPVLVMGQAGLMLVVATLACRRAGRAIVPVDPAASPLRLEQIALVTGADVLVRLEADELPAVDALSPGRIRTILFETVASGPVPAPAPDRAGRDAFIVFTSGSTGVPKGACHSPACHDEAIAVEVAALDVRAGDRVALVTPPATISAPTLPLAVLAAGATLLLLPARVPIAALAEMLERERATHLLCFVGLARAAATHPRAAAAFGHLRDVQVYGDIIRADDCAVLRGVLPPDARIHLNYSSTEAYMMAGCVALPGMASADGRMPLGRPLPGIEVWLRASPDDGPVPTTGELCLSGPRVARGYWRDARAGEGRFEPHPLDPGRQLFRIGDLARVRPDGLIDFLGRIDNQVKLRGWRIELEEIETVVRRVAGVEGAGVVARRDAEGMVEALALHVATPGPEAAVRSALDGALRDGLPDFMRPATIILADRIPLTGNGKVDRLRLAEVDRQVREAGNAVRAGAGPAPAWPDALSARIAAVIADEAELAALGPDDNLNALGVDSLQAVYIALRVEKQWAVTLEAADLLDERPMAALVAAIAAAVRAAAASPPGSRC